MKGDFSVVREDGAKITVLAYRKPKKHTKTWNTATGHTFNYVGLGGRGAAKGKSTKTFSI
jgi:hypothetical protein